MKKEYNFKKMRKREGPLKVYPEAAKATITMRIDAITLGDIKTEAERLGMPYQTLVQSVLHRFVTGELVDKKTRAG